MSKRALISDAHKLMRDARKRAKKKNIGIDITSSDIIAHYTRQRGLCALSGRPLLFGDTSRNNHDAVSLDRIVAGRAYTDSNVQLLCRCVNTAKSTLSTADFVLMCEDVAKCGKVAVKECYLLDGAATATSPPT